MKTNYFTKVEDKYVFRVSTAFWHLLIGLLTVATVVGVVLLAWSLFPSSKEIVKSASYPSKPSFPPMANVTVGDLKIDEKKVVPSPAVQQAPPTEYNAPEEITNDPDEPAYKISVAQLKKLIPKDQWQSGSWVYPYGEDLWQQHQSDPNYRHWVGGDNVEKALERSYIIIRAKKYSAKKAVLDSYLKILKQTPPAGNIEVLNTIINNLNERFSDIHLLDSAFNLVAINLKTFPISKEAAQHLIAFSLHNPKMTFEFIPFAAQACSQIPSGQRFAFLNSLTAGFYNYFRNNTNLQKEATQQFIKLLPQVPNADPAYLLGKFYSIYVEKNQQRNEEIDRLTDDYNNQIAAIVADSTMRATEAEAKFFADKEKKSDLRLKSFYLIAGGFIAIALLGTILTLLSIQRILKRIEMNEENKIVN